MFVRAVTLQYELLCDVTGVMGALKMNVSDRRERKHYNDYTV